MPETPLPLVEQYLRCALCGTTYHDSQIAMRGRMNFCTACASVRSGECLAKLNGGKGHRGALVAAIVLAAGLIGAGGWFGSRAYFAHRAASAPAPASPTTTVATAPPSSAAPAAAANETAPDKDAKAGAESSSSSEPTLAASSSEHSAGAPSVLSALIRAFDKDSAPSKPAEQKTPRTVSDVGNIHLLFVTRPGTDASMGLASRLFITREAASSETAKLMTKVGPDMETSFQEGLRYVEKLPRDWEKEFSIRLSFEDKFSSKDGGSAGTAFTVAMLAAIQKVSLDPTMAITGDLTIDGEVQPVGGVVEKTRGTIAAKCGIMLVPERNKRDIDDFALLDGISPLWDVQILSIRTIDEALSLARQDRPEKLKAALDRFSQLRARLPAVVTPNYLQSPIVQSELQQVLQDAPNHLSAAILLHTARKEMPKELTLNRSVDEIIGDSYLFVSSALSSEKEKTKSGEKGLTIFPEHEFGECMRKLAAVTPLLDKRSINLKAACINYAGCLRAVVTYKAADTSASRTPDQWREFAVRERGYARQTLQEFDDARSNLVLAIHKLDTDGSLISELNKK